MVVPCPGHVPCPTAWDTEMFLNRLGPLWIRLSSAFCTVGLSKLMSVAAGAGACTALTDGGDVAERRALWVEVPSTEFMERGFSEETPRRVFLDRAVKVDSWDV